jgi:hypothetical protein
MFPLGTALLPGEVLPLHVFEPRYRVMVAALLEGSGELGIVLIERGHEVGGGDQRFGVGCLARVVSAERSPDGRYALVVVGVAPISVTRWLDDDPYPRALVVERVEPTTAALPAIDGAVRAVRERAQALADALGAQQDLATVYEGQDAGAVVHRTVALFGIGALDRQRLLEARDVGKRLELLAAELDDAIALAALRREPPGGQ